MPREPYTCCLITALLVIVAAPLGAQTSRPSKKADAKLAPSPIPKGVSLDELSRDTFARWHRLEYHLGRAGITKLHFEVEVKSSSPFGKVETTGTYQRDDTRSKLTWSDPTLSTMLALRGWSVHTFNRWLDRAGLLGGLHGAKLRAKKQAKGEIEIKVDGGKASSDIHSLSFDTAGRLSALTLGSRGVAVRVDLHYRPHQAQVLLAGWKFRIDSELGPLTGRTSFTYRSVDGYQVLAKAEESLTGNSQSSCSSTLEFSKHVLGKATTPQSKTKKKSQNGERTQRRQALAAAKASTER